MVEQINTVLYLSICRKTTDSMCNGIRKDLLNGPIKSDLIPPLPLRRFWPPVKLNNKVFRSCMGLLKLADRYSITRLEAACKKALSYTPSPSLKSVKNILATGQDKENLEQTAKTSDNSAKHGFTRGADYYGRL
jgi:hypothetical protein